MSKSNRRDNGGSAFPRTGFYPETGDVHREDLHAVLSTVTDPADGMTLRDYVAAKCLAALIAAGYSAADRCETRPMEGVKRIVRAAFVYADAFVRERAQVAATDPVITPEPEPEGE